MKKILAGLLTAAMIVGMTACGGQKPGPQEAAGPTAENPLTIKWGLSVSTSNQAFINAQVVADHVMEATGGAIKMELYPNSQLGNEAAMWEGILSGTIDMANISTATLSSTIPDFEAFTLPCVFGNAETFWNVMSQEEFREKFSERAAEKGAVFVGISSMFTRGIASKSPITLPEDVHGKKMRIMSGHTYSDMFDSWGAGTVIMGFNEVYTALQQDVIDGLCVDVGGAVDQKFFEQAPYFVDTFHAFHCSPGVMRSGLWNSLSPDQQQAFVDGYKLVAEKGAETYYAELEDSVKKAEEMGVTFTWLTPEQKQEWVGDVTWMYEDYPYIDKDFLKWFIEFIDANRVESAK